MNLCRTIAAVGVLLMLGGCFTVDDDILPTTREYFYTLHNAVIEESGDDYVVVSRDNMWHSGVDTPDVAQGYCDKTETVARWEAGWLENSRQYARYSCNG